MLVPSPLLSDLFIQAIAYFKSFYIKLFHPISPYTLQPISTPLTVCSDRYGAFYLCIMLYQWFIVARSLGLYHPLHPYRKIKITSSHKPIIYKSPPAPNYNRLQTIFAIYLVLICTHVHAIHQEYLPLCSLSALPTTILSLSGLSYIQQYRDQRKILRLLTSIPCASTTEHQLCNDLFSDTKSNSKTLAMLSAWQTTNSKTPVLMDYYPGSKAICIDTGASACISNDRNDFISYFPVTDQVISGISSGLSVAGRGTLHWNIRDNDGNNIFLHVSDALHVPNVPICLLCLQYQILRSVKMVVRSLYHVWYTHLFPHRTFRKYWIIYFCHDFDWKFC